MFQEYTLNAQQLVAVAPVVCVVDEMWANRTNQSNDFADGNSSQQCSCLWLGAGGSGKTYAYAKVIRPLFKRYFGQQGFVVGAPTHAAVRLLGLEARTLHKLANASPQTRVDRKSLRNAPRKADALEMLLQKAFACVLDEISMSPPEVYHAASYRCSLLRQERLELDMAQYLTQWFGKMNVSIQLGETFSSYGLSPGGVCANGSKRVLHLLQQLMTISMTKTKMMRLVYTFCFQRYAMN